MVEYGHGVGTATEVAGGGAGGGGGTMDIGQAASGFVNDAVHTVSTLPPEALVVLAIALLFGLMMLRKAF